MLQKSGISLCDVRVSNCKFDQDLLGLFQNNAFQVVNFSFDKASILQQLARKMIDTVYIFYVISCAVTFFLGYVSIGCYKDTGSRAIAILEGKDSILDGPYPHRVNPIAKCAVAAMRRGYNMFAVQHGGQCFSSCTAHWTFNKYGKSTACWNGGEGGPWANEVYFIA